jgi:branched-chain amino acid transport system permease protein
VIGGWGTFGGPILGAGIVIGLDQYLVAIGDYRELFLGLILAFIAVFAPRGLWPAIRGLYDRYLAPEAPAPALAEAPLQPKEAPPEDTL